MTRQRSPETATAPSRRLTYEGFPLEAVLARVHATHGADATIVAADRIRRGGVAGFFARELFQVTVATEPVDAPSSGDAAEVDARLATGSDVDTDIDADLDGVDAAAIGAADADDLDDAEIDPEDIDGALSLPVATALRSTPADTERDAVEDEIWALVADVAKRSVAASATEPAPTVTERSEAPDADAVVVPELVTPVADVDAVASTTLIAPRRPAPAPTAPVASAPSRVTSAPVTTAPVAAAAPAPAPFLPAAEIPTPTALVSTTPRRDASVIGMRPHRLRRSLAEPVDLLGVIEAFESLVPAPPLPTEGIVAVVGARSDALTVAGRLAAELGVAPEAVIVAGPGNEVVVPSDEDVLRLAASTRYRCTPVALIVVELVPGRLGHEWARAVLEGLRAEQVRYAADAGRLAAQQHLGMGIAALGGVDLIDLLGISGHHEPVSVLDLGTPIATIDGRPATPEMWAATALAGHVAHLQARPPTVGSPPIAPAAGAPLVGLAPVSTTMRPVMIDRSASAAR